MSWTQAPAIARAGLAHVLGGVAAVALLAALMYAAATVDRYDADGVRVLQQAEFIPAGGAARPVTLPHTWARDGAGNAGQARYRLEFALDAVPVLPWALDASRLRRATPSG